jgi:hypothetical protein
MPAGAVAQSLTAVLFVARACSRAGLQLNRPSVPIDGFQLPPLLISPRDQLN